MDKKDLRPLSDSFDEHLRGRRLISAVFFTYQFDPCFFEEDILPVFLNIPVSHNPKVRIVQLEEALRHMQGDIAVYYDVNRLCIETGSPRLDIRRIPVRHKAVFHPKNVFLLTEPEEPDDEYDIDWQRNLIVATLSANLTRSGWWENVEVCHLHVIDSDDKSSIRDDLSLFLRKVRDKAPKGTAHNALESILYFLRYRAFQRETRSREGVLLPQFYNGEESVTDFIDRVAGPWVRRANLEVISPYFDKHANATPLHDLIERFSPSETRVFLPKDEKGQALCRPELHEDVRNIPNTCWGRFPDDILKSGKAEQAAKRFVHAKVYRFFTAKPKRELFFVGSVNLTNAAHSGRANIESGILLEITPLGRPDWWLTIETRKPAAFSDPRDSEDNSTIEGSALSLRYDWSTSKLEAYWGKETDSPPLSLFAYGRGLKLGDIGPLKGDEYLELPNEVAINFAGILRETSYVEVHGESQEPKLILVEETGMESKPSFFLSLSLADILRCWSILTPDQRSAFLEEKASELLLPTQHGSDTLAKINPLPKMSTVFDRVAGFFHAFSRLEHTIKNSIEEGRDKEALALLFGKKYDSLGSVLERVSKGTDGEDIIDRYLVALCARQLCDCIKKDKPEFWQLHREAADDLLTRLQVSTKLRSELLTQHAASIDGSFLDWFDNWFLKRANAIEEVPA